MSRPSRSKTLSAWLALLFGAFGVHRLYLNGLGDWRAWAHVPPTSLGLFGVERMQQYGQDDRLAWVLIPLLGLMLSKAALEAMLFALTPDERWDDRHNPGHAVVRTGWGAVLAAVAALAAGGIVLIGTIAFGTQKLFEAQAAPQHAFQNIQVLPT